MRTALFIMPLSVSRASGPVAAWLLAAGWAAAAARMLGEACVVTPQGRLTPHIARTLAARCDSKRTEAPLLHWLAPQVVRTALKDVRQHSQARVFARDVMAYAADARDVAFVWQHHQLFHRSGEAAARLLGCPFILHVDAPIVWEARRWGVKRPVWGSLLERYVESQQLRAANLITCPSSEVADEVSARGVPTERIMVTPGGVDTEVFSTQATGESIRTRYDLGRRFVVGWTGSFRKFHGLEVAIEAFVRLQRHDSESALLLVGDGFDRKRLEGIVKSTGANNVVFSGTVPHAHMPHYLAAMDAALVLGDPTQGFHYSPMKLREYMAAGKAVVACRLGELERVLTHGADALLVPVGDAEALGDALISLRQSAKLRERLGSAARKRILTEGAWSVQVQKVCRALGMPEFSL